MHKQTVVAIDMDGTLLDDNNQMPEGFFDLLPRYREAGLLLTPASGRQLATLRSMFAAAEGGINLIAENGAVVEVGGEIVDTTPMRPADVHAVLDALEPHHAALVCEPEMAYALDASVGEVRKYYHAITEVDDLREVVSDNVIKLAIYNPEGSAKTAPVLRAAAPEVHVIESSPFWADVMDPAANKGTALQHLADHLGLPVEKTIAFGDYLNDLEMLRLAGTSYAMANAHPEVKAIADKTAPSNNEAGVLQVLNSLL